MTVLATDCQNDFNAASAGQSTSLCCKIADDYDDITLDVGEAASIEY